MLQRLKWPGAAVALALVGTLARRWQLASAFDSEGLAQRGAAASWAMLAFYILAGAVFLCLAHGMPGSGQPEGRLSRWDTAFAAKGDRGYLILMAASAALTLAAAPLFLREAARLIAVRKATGIGDNGILQVILALCAIPACWTLLMSAISAFRMKGRGKENASLLLPVLLCCVWMLEAYRANAADPVLWDYVPLLLAAALGLLFYLDCAGMSFEGGHPRRMLWLAAMTVVTSAAAMAGQQLSGAAALLGGQMLAALAALWRAPANLRCPPGAEQFGLRAARRAQKKTNGSEEKDGITVQEIQEEDSHV